MSREDVIRQILQRETAGQSLCEATVCGDNVRLLEQACELFGSWETALAYSGVSQSFSENQALSRLKVISRLRYMCHRGYILTAKHNMQRDRAFFNTARRHFGTWRKALRAAGIRPENATGRTASHMDIEMLLDWIRDRSSSGKSMKWTDVCLEYRDIAISIKGRIGSWKQARQTAGRLET